MKSKPEGKVMPWSIVIVFLIISFGSMGAGLYYYNSQIDQIKETKADELSSITALKVNEITRWREELISKANIIANTPVLTRQFVEFIKDRENTVAENSILVWMVSILKHNDFDCISLLDSSGNVVLSSTENGRISKPCLSEHHEDEIKTHKILLADFHRTDENTHMSMFIPIFDPDDNTVQTGLLFLRIDLDRFLSIIAEWPTPTETAETLIVRKEGNEILFLSELRHQEVTALSLRMPVSEVSLPAAMAARGETGIVEGLDYRNVKVLASIEPIPDTQWFIISKVDQDEIYTQVKRTSFYFGVLEVIFLLFIGFSLFFLWYTSTTRYQIKEREANYVRNLIESSLDPFFIISVNGIILDINEAAELLFGVPRDKIIGSEFHNKFHHARKIKELLGLTILKGSVMDFNVTIDSSGAESSLLLNTSLYKNEAGETGGIFVAARDVTDLKHIEDELKKSHDVLEKLVDERTKELSDTNVKLEREVVETNLAKTALQESEDRYRTLVESTHDGVVVTTGEGEFLFVNSSYASMLGYSSPDELIGTLAIDRYAHPEERAEIFKRLSKDGYADNHEVGLLKKDGTIISVSCSTVLKKDESGKIIHVQAFVRDISERKKAEAELKQYRNHLEEMVEKRTAQLESANKELEAFSYSVSHDLRAPLRSIDGFSHILLEDYPDKLDEQGKNYLNRVRAASQKMAKLIDAILSLSRLTRGEMKRSTVDLTGMVKSIVIGLKIAHPDRKVEFVIAENVTANCDAMMLQITLDNLLGNACKFTGKHPTAKIEFGITEKDGKTVYFVKDDGAGFEMVYADKLFIAFQRLHTDSEFKGIGIGLATVQRIIHRHGGEIWAEGEVEKGATFYFTLE